jgi:hypothetical protein
MFECSADSDVVVACFNYFSEIITKKTVVIIDNAPTRTSQEFEDHIEEREEKGLFIKNYRLIRRNSILQRYFGGL